MDEELTLKELTVWQRKRADSNNYDRYMQSVMGNMTEEMEAKVIWKVHLDWLSTDPWNLSFQMSVHSEMYNPQLHLNLQTITTCLPLTTLMKFPP